MSTEMFSFVAVRDARPLAVDHWLQVRTREPDVQPDEFDGALGTLSARPDDLTRYDQDVVHCLEQLSWWLVAGQDLRERRDIVDQLAGRVVWRKQYRELADLIGADEYRQGRAAIVDRLRAADRTDELAARLLVVCGLLERLATGEGTARLSTATAVANWLAAAVIADDGPADPARTGSSFAVRRSLVDLGPTLRRLPSREPLLPRSITGRVRHWARRTPAERDTPAWLPRMALSRAPAVGDLFVVEQKLCGYEAGEVADIENILAGETKERRDRDLTITEEETENETLRSTERTESTEQRDATKMTAESQHTLSNSSQFHANLNVEADYFVKVTADTGFSADNSTTKTDKAAAEIAKEVTLKTSRRVAESELIRQRSLRRREFERRFWHKFTAPDENTSGVYRHIDAVWKASVVKYEPRLLCELVVPEPAIALRRLLHGSRPKPDVGMDEPTRPAFTAAEITRGNWAARVRDYGALGVPPPPEPVLIVTRSFKSEAPPPAGSSESGEQPKTSRWPQIAVFEASDSVAPPDGYVATMAEIVVHSVDNYTPLTDTSPNWTNVRASVAGKPLEFLPNEAIGLNLREANVGIGQVESGVTETVAFTVAQFLGYGFTGTIRITCQLTGEAFGRWQTNVYNRIITAYTSAKQDYDAALADAKRDLDDRSTVMRSSTALGLIKAELKRLCLTMLSGPAEFPRPATVTLFTDEQWGVPNAGVNIAERERILFLEQAFDWDLIQYVPYSFFWAEKKRWEELLATDDGDAVLTEFERAGAVRVVLPARRAFRQAVGAYLHKGLIWNGDHPPCAYDDPLYVSIAMELAELRDRPRKGTVVDTWKFRLPTPHLLLDELPRCPEDPEEDETEQVGTGDGRTEPPRPSPRG